jgi:hypothetical protein
MGATAACADARRSSRGAFGERAQGRAVVYRAADGTPQDIDGIFRRPSAQLELQPSGNTMLVSGAARLGAVGESWFAVRPGPGCEVDVGGKTWGVVNVHDDGEGGLTFDLTEVP